MNAYRCDVCLEETGDWSNTLRMLIRDCEITTAALPKDDREVVERLISGIRRDEAEGDFCSWGCLMRAIHILKRHDVRNRHNSANAKSWGGFVFGDHEREAASK